MNPPAPQPVRLVVRVRPQAEGTGGRGGSSVLEHLPGRVVLQARHAFPRAHVRAALSARANAAPCDAGRSLIRR